LHNFCGGKKLCQNLETPFNRMISHTSSYLVFVGLLIFVLANPLNNDGNVRLG
jgi:hypothetical protein